MKLKSLMEDIAFGVSLPIIAPAIGITIAFAINFTPILIISLLIFLNSL
jgi:hypothetical protein